MPVTFARLLPGGSIVAKVQAIALIVAASQGVLAVAVVLAVVHLTRHGAHLGPAALAARGKL